MHTATIHHSLIQSVGWLGGSGIAGIAAILGSLMVLGSLILLGLPHSSAAEANRLPRLRLLAVSLAIALAGLSWFVLVPFPS